MAQPRITSFLSIFTNTATLLSVPKAPPELMHLPVVDVGTHDGHDVTLPAAKAGHRVYSFEPSLAKYDAMLYRFRHKKWNLTHTTELQGFTRARPGTVFLRQAVAVSNTNGHTTFWESRYLNGVGNSLSKQALRHAERESAQLVNVTTLTLADVLANESGVYFMKIDSQGYELHVLRGAEAFIRSRPVYILKLEYNPQLLKAVGTAPLDLLHFISELGYQCSDTSFRLNPHLSLSLPDFVRHYDTTKRWNAGFGVNTDLVCLRNQLFGG